MLVKVTTIVFYAALALFFFGVGFPFLEIIIACCAVVLAIIAFQ